MPRCTAQLPSVPVRARGLSGFAAPFRGKKIPPSLFWGTFDMTTVLFSGKPCPFERTASIVERVAFDEQFVEFGFWPGDDATNDPSFFVLAYPFIEKGSSSDANVDEAFFDVENSEYFLRLKDALRYDDPQAAVLGSAPQRSRASWNGRTGNVATGSPSRC